MIAIYIERQNAYGIISSLLTPFLSHMQHLQTPVMHCPEERGILIYGP